MPWYEYACETCGAATAQRRPADERDDAPACPACGGPTRRRFNTFVVNWNGPPPSKGGVNPVTKRWVEDAPLRIEQQVARYGTPPKGV